MTRVARILALANAVLVSTTFAAEPPNTAVPVAPLSLTASDGTGLKLVSLVARAVVDDPIAFTELRLAFQNPEPRTIEGQFRIALPQTATISRFAMRLGDRWQEGEVVEKQAARRAYEDFLHRRQDPALLEQGAGNEFTARVFPIPAKGVKELVVSYSQELSGAGAKYELPLRGLPQLGELDVSIFRRGEKNPVAALAKKGFVPNADLAVPVLPVEARGGLRHANLAVARVRPLSGSAPDPVESAILLVDTSASRALGFAEELRLVSALVQSLGKAPIAVAAFDQEVLAVHEGPASAFGDQEMKKLRDRRPLGASDLAKALVWAEAQAKKSPAKRVILVTDGVATAGATDGDPLTVLARKLKAAGVERLDAVAVGGIRDDAMLKRLATAGLSRDGVVLEASLGASEIARRLGQATRANLEVKVAGAAWWWPRKLGGVQPGDEVLVWADLPAGKPLEVSVAGAAVKVGELPTVERPLLERAWMRAKIASLMEDYELKADGPKAKDELRRQIIDLSVSHRVLCAFTALLVLETEQDYARFDIGRRALADILTVSDAGTVGVAKRSERPASAQAPAEPPRQQRKDAVAVKTKPPEAPGLWDRMKSFLGSSSAPAEAGQAAPAVVPADAPSRRMRSPIESSPAPASQGALADAPSPRGGETPMESERMLMPSAMAKEEAFEEVKAAAPEPMERSASRGAVSEAPLPSIGGAPAPAAPAPHPSAAPRDSAGEPAFYRSDDERETPRAASRPARRERASRPSSRPLPEPEMDDLEGLENEPGDPMPRGADAFTGKFKVVMDLVRAKSLVSALAAAWSWREEEPGDVMALVGLGKALEASGDLSNAARAYGSLIDLFASRADLRRFAGELLEGLAKSVGLELAADSYAKGAEQRPDHPAGHRLLAFALVKRGRPAEAFAAMARALKERYPEDRFAGVHRILREDLGLIAAAWAKAEPEKKDEIARKLREAGGEPEDGPSLRFVLNWETDANDVDFHIQDGRGGHAYYGAMALRSGGSLYADVTTGYGPECFTIRKAKGKRAGPYKLQAHYYSRGPMGYGMGKLEVVDHDGKGGLTFEERPFVVMVDGAFVNLGTVAR